ncbi:MAG: right-handed parallel beta-helix repeat-containing protein [Candidatus Micrarchaeota archaeon]
MFSITQKLFSSGFFLVLLLSLAFSLDIATCTDISSGGTYALTADINVSQIGESSCFNITGNNVYLDLQNHRIDGVSGAGSGNGVFNLKIADGVTYLHNITIANGELRYSANNVPLLYLFNVMDSRFTNLTIANVSTVSDQMVSVYNAHSNNFSNMTIANSTFMGLYLSSSSNNSLDNITVSGCGEDGIKLSGSSNNNITNSIIRDNLGNGIETVSLSRTLFFANLSISGHTATDKSGIVFATDGMGSTNNNLSNVTATRNYNGIYLACSGGVCDTNNFTLINVTNNTNDGFKLQVTNGGSTANHGVFDFADVSNNTRYGIFISAPDAMGSKVNMTFKGGVVYGNGNAGIYVNDTSLLGAYSISHLRIKDMVLYNNSYSNINITATYNTTLSNVSSYFSGAVPARWMSIYTNRTTGLKFSSISFLTNGTGFSYYNVTTSNFNATNCLYTSGTKNANVSLYTNGGNYTVTAWNASPATAPYGNDLGYYLNITNDSAETSLNLTFYWTDSDAVGKDMSLAKMYKYSGGAWTEITSTNGVTTALDTTAKSISANNVSSFSVFAIFAPTAVSSGQATSTSDSIVREASMSHELSCDSEILTVSLEDDSGKAVNGAIISVRDLANVKLLSSSTNAEGVATIDVSSLQDGSYLVTWYKPGYNGEQSQSFNKQCNLGLIATAEVECPSGAILVTVRDDAGNYVQDASVYFSQLDAKSTDMDGKARLYDMAGQAFASGSSYYVMVNKDGYSSTSVEVPYASCQTEQGRLEVDVSKNCPDGIVISVADSISGPVANADVTVDVTVDGTRSTTNADGKASIFLANGVHSIVVYVSGYAEGFYEITYDLSCEGSGGKKGDITTPVGTECSSDDECAPAQACVDGACKLLTGECGHVDNHKWIVDACCNEYVISAPANVYVGDTATVTITRCGKPVSETQVTITNPKNEVKTVSTDMAGRTTVPVDFAGIYKLQFAKQGIQLGSKSIQGDLKQVVPDQTKKRGILGGDPNTDNLLLIIALIVAVVVILYLRNRGGKKKYSSKQK